MPELIEKNNQSVVDNELTSTEIERLQNAGVEVETPDEDGDGSGSGSGPNLDEDEEEQEQEQSGGSGGDESEEESDDVVDEMGSDGEFSDEELDEMVENSDVANEDVDEGEAQEHAEALQAAGGGEGRIEDDSLETFEYESEWATEADQLSRHLERVVGEHLRRERKTQVSRGEDFGDFDSGRMLQADRGSTDVFKRKNDPDEKAYHVVLIMDDSGSMGGGFDSRLHHAAVGTAALCRALEAVGIDVTVYRFARNVRIVKTANQTYGEAKDSILQNETNGGTRLLPALKQIDELAQQFGDETFSMVMTDGKPKSKTKVVEQLEELTSTTMCLQIAQTHERFEDTYDGFAYVDSKAEIRSKTESIFRRVVL